MMMRVAARVPASLPRLAAMSACRPRSLASPATASTASRGDFAVLEPRDIEIFRSVLGDAGVLTADAEDYEELRQYNRDWMGKWEGRSKCVLKPKTTEEVSKVLRHCNERRLAVVPQSGNTGLVGGSIPVHDEVVLSCLRMNEVEQLDTRSGIVTVQAGCVLENLDNHVAEHGLMVPLDLGAKGTCTIGGNAATNAGGLRYLRYGSLRGNILGIEAVLADGTVVDALSTLRKDNTGYGLPQLFIGSEGTLGMITRLSLLLPPRPTAVNVAFFGCQDFDAVQRTFALARRNLGEVLSAVEFCDRTALDFVIKREAEYGVKDPLQESCPFYDVIETSGSNQDHDEEKLHNFLEVAMGGEDDDQPAVSDGIVAADMLQMQAIWRLREGISDAMTTAGYVYKYDVSLPLDRMYDLVDDTKRMLSEQGFTDAHAVGYGHLGDSNLHLNVTNLSGKDDRLLAALEPWVFEWVAKCRGSISAEHGIGQCKPQFLHLSKSENAISLMKGIKAQLDPQGILNPYKVLI